MPNSCRLPTLGTNEHCVRDVDWHGLVNHASLTGLTLRAHMLLDNIQAFNDDLVNLWHGPRYRSLLPPVLTCNDQDGVSLLDIHLGKMEWLLLFLFCCHLLFLLKHLRRKRNDLHEVSFAQFAGNRAKDTCTSWIITRGNDHGSILLKTDLRSIAPPICLGHAHYHSIDDFSLLDSSIRCSLLHSGLYNIPHLRITLCR